ncbi:MAG: hypothetical protein RI993_440 [Pseudomonadota bacterium]|jgi:EAL domain-containing protein (putative c-di-GMP-specific phosphodiesterase class I)
MNTQTTHAFTARDEFELVRSATDYPLERAENGWVSGYFYRCRLTSVFQAVFDAATNKTIGHAAYARSESNNEIALWPWQIFSMASGDDQLVSLDRLCRAIHSLNYFKKPLDSSRLFVSVHPRLLESVKDDHGRAFEDFLGLIGVRTSQVVIEIPSSVNRNWELLQKVIANYRSRGYLVAANYSKNGSSKYWMAELGSLYPDIVRIEADELLRHAKIDDLVDVIYDFGASLLAWNVETPRHLYAVKRAKVHYLQGNYLAKPAMTIHSNSPRYLRENLSEFTY